MGTATAAAPLGVLRTETAARAGIGTQLLKSADDVRPAPHALQSVKLDAPVTFEAEPTGQAWHEVSAAAPGVVEKVPFGHDTHVALLMAASALE